MYNSVTNQLTCAVWLTSYKELVCPCMCALLSERRLLHAFIWTCCSVYLDIKITMSNQMISLTPLQ